MIRVGGRGGSKAEVAVSPSMERQNRVKSFQSKGGLRGSGKAGFSGE